MFDIPTRDLKSFGATINDLSAAFLATADVIYIYPHPNNGTVTLKSDNISKNKPLLITKLVKE